MPGCGLTAVCHCGYSVQDLIAGATADGHYELLFCDVCGSLKSVWVSRASGKKKGIRCRKCKSNLLRITDSGFWIPRDLQKDHPNKDPWLIVGARKDQIRFLCPGCKRFSLEINQSGLLWD